MPIDLRNIISVNRVNKILLLLKEGELVNNPNWTNILKKGERTTVGTLIPIIQGSSMDVKEEFEPFVTAILRDPRIGCLVNQHRNLPTLANLVKGSNMLPWVGNSAVQSKTRESLFMWADESKDNITILLHAIQIIKAAFLKRRTESSMKIIQRFIDSGKKIDDSQFLEWYTSGLFDSKALTDRKTEMITSSVFGPNVRTLAANINIIRDAHLAHKPKYI